MLNIINKAPKKQQAPAPDDLIVDWQPQLGEIVLFRDSTSGKYRYGMYVALWAELAPNQDCFESSPYLPECMPYCGTEEKMVIRAKVNYAHRMADGTWEISNNFDYADISHIYENTRDNRIFAADYNAIKNAIADKAVA